MNILFLDFETYFSPEYSLRNMPPPNYILDPRFETILVAVKENDQPAKIITGDDFPAYIASHDPTVTVTVTHNALFDNAILAWHYGFVPKQMVDTLGMARALLGHKLKSLSLGAVAEYLKLGKKDIQKLMNVQGLRRAQLMHNLEFRQYALDDVNMCAGIYAKLNPEFPHSERRVMDLVLRCAIQPEFLIDVNMLEDHISTLRSDKMKLITAAGVDKEKLMSSDKFKAALEARGVDIEYKVSPTGKKIPAFAKTDNFMDELANHPDPIVQALAAARLGHKSTIEETRAERMISIAKLPWWTLPDGNPRIYSGGTFPVPLRYAGAHTHRLSGEWKINPQNMPSSRKEGSKLRKAVIAPPGYKVIVADLGQIEARLTAWLCGQQSLLDQFAGGHDPYMILGAQIFGIEKPDKNVHTFERFIGKGGVLGLGFGCGVDKFYNMVLRSARVGGMDTQKLLERWNLDVARKAVTAYRDVNKNIVQMWYKLNTILRREFVGVTAPVTLMGCVEIGHGYVRGPNGLEMRYDSPNVTREGEVTYMYGGRMYRIHGAYFLENIIQFLARIVIMNVALRLQSQGMQFALQAHDELAYIVPDEKVDETVKLVHTEMVRRPSWAPDLPLKADVNFGQSYGDAK